MHQFLDYIKTGYADLNDQKRIVELIEKLYFSHIVRPFKRLKTSEEFQIANDLIRIEMALADQRSIKGVELNTAFALSLVKGFLKKSNLTKAEIDRITNECINKHRYYITTAFVADIINKEHRIDLLKWTIGTMVTFLTASIVFSGIFYLVTGKLLE